MAGALLASLLLAVHPVGVEVVGFVTARNNLFALLFSLASVLLFVDAERRNSAKRAALSAVALLLGLLGKEPAVMVLPLLGAILWLPELRSEPPAWRRLRLLAPHLLAIGAYLVLRTVSLGGLGGPAAATGALAGGWLHRLSLNYFAVPTYLVLLAFPRDLTIYHVLPEASPFTLLWAAAVWILLAAAVVALLRNRSAATTVGLLWFGLGLLPVSNLFSLPTATVIAERYIFFPAVGLWLVVGAFVDRLWRRRSLRLPAGIVAGVVTVTLAFRSHARTLDWKDDLSLDCAAVAVEPRSATAHLNLGSSLQGSGDLVGAWAAWREAARLAPDDAGPWAAMGLQAQREGDRRLAAEFLLKALRLDPSQVASLVALGDLHDEAGDRERARAEWKRPSASIRATPAHWSSWNLLGRRRRSRRGRTALPRGPGHRSPRSRGPLQHGEAERSAGTKGRRDRIYERFLAAPGADPAAARIAAERIRKLGAGGR